MHLGATLRLLRLESGLGLRDLARRLGVSGTYLSRVENGLDASPTPARLEAIARELALPRELLLALAPQVNPLVVDYVHAVPNAGALFLEIAQRRLNDAELDEVRAFLGERFPMARSTPPLSTPGVSELLSEERIVLGFASSDLVDALDVLSGRLASATGSTPRVIARLLREREREVPSGLGRGVAVCSVHVEGVAPTAALVTLAEPLDSHTPDALPLSVLFALVGPRAWSERRFVLAEIARLAARDLGQKLLGANSARDALSRLGLLETWR